MLHKKFSIRFQSACGQTALITGGGTGLGLGMAKCFVASGARVILVGRRQKELEKARAALGENAFSLVGDVTRLETIPALVEQAEKTAGPVSILVNNAGTHLKKSALETSDAEFASVLQTHVFGAFALSRELGRHMVARKSGNILFTASMASLFGIPLVVAFPLGGHNRHTAAWSERSLSSWARMACA